MAMIILNKRDTTVKVRLRTKMITILARQMSDTIADSEYSDDLKRKENAGDVVVSCFEDAPKRPKRGDPKKPDKKDESEDRS